MNVCAFERLSIRERGHFSNYFTFNPVLKLEFRSASLLVVRRSGSIEHAYRELNADILKTYKAKGYGKSAHSYIPQTLITIEGPSLSCRFDASAQFADFRYASELLNLVREHIHTTEQDEALVSVKRRHAIVAAAFLSTLAAVAYIARSYGI